MANDSTSTKTNNTETESLRERIGEIDKLLSSQKTLSDPARLKELSQERTKTQEELEIREKLDKTQEELNQAKELLSDPSEEIQEIAQEDVTKLEKELTDIQKALQESSKETDPDDTRSAIIEIRAGAGGEEASLFAGDLYRMYLRFAERNNFKAQQLHKATTSTGGFKEVTALLSGQGAFGLLKNESGVHRVQRVPVTESSGRIHTSTASVAVLPEAQDVNIEIKPEDIRIDVFRATGAGGQCVNTTDSAVRITHLPTDITVSCQESKSQLKNRETAMKILKSRLYEQERQQLKEARDEQRLSQIGSGMRSEKIRTYNFPQDRITDHRIKKSWHNIQSILDGDLTDIIESVKMGLEDNEPEDPKESSKK